MMTDWELVRDYAANRSQPAFSRLVERHLAFVYHVCLRQTHDQQLAEDAAMAVFLLLSQKAHTLRSGAPLTSWLFTTARLTALNAARQERRRRAAEQKAGEMAHQQGQYGQDRETLVEERLNDALAALSERERQAVLLRYQDDLEVAQVGRALGISETAAQMRLSRGLEKMRRFCAANGATQGASAISSTLIAARSKAAPAGLTAKVNTMGAVGPALTPIHPLIAKGVLIVSTSKIVAGGVAAVVILLCLAFMAVRHAHSSASSSVPSSVVWQAPPAPNAATQQSQASSSAATPPPVVWQAPPAPNAATQQAQQQIKATIAQFDTAWDAGDLQGVMAVNKGNYSLTSPEYSKRVQNIARQLSPSPHTCEFTVTSCVVTGNTAIVLGQEKETMGTSVFSGPAHITMLIRDGKWQIDDMGPGPPPHP